MFRRLQWVGFVLVVLGLARAGVLVAHDPLVGYANQFDMHRTGACVGLYPVLEGDARLRATPEAPLPLYRFEKPREDCYPATEVALVIASAMAATALDADAAGFRLRWMGYAKLALLGLTALLLCWTLREHPVASLWHGTVFLLVMADPAVTLWFNTFYTEFSVAWGLYAAIGAIGALALVEDTPIAPWILLACGLVALAFSKEQYALLPVAFAVVALPWLWVVSRPATISVVLVTLAASAVSMLAVPRPVNVQLVNRTNTYLGIVVPAATDRAQAMSVLGLSARCTPLVGASWYLPRGENLKELCPEVFAIPSHAFLRFAATDPEALARSVGLVLPRAQAVMPSYLGTLEGGEKVTASALPAWAFSPLDALATRMPLAVFIALALAMMLAAPLAALAALAWARPASGNRGVALLLAMLLGGTVLHAAISTVFGDGGSEAARHYWAGHLATAAGVLAFLFALAGLPSRWLANPRASAWEMVASVVVVAVVATSIIATLRWARTQPLAIGVIDEPEGREAKAAGFKLKGWALEPFGVDAVQVHLGNTVLAPRFGEAATPDLLGVFPGYPDAGRGRYELDITAEQLAKAAGDAKELALRVRVKGREGALTEVDARRLKVVD